MESSDITFIENGLSIFKNVENKQKKIIIN